MNLLEPAAAAVLVVVIALLLGVLLLQRRSALRPPANDETLDTVQAWPPQAVRVMTLRERQAYEILRRAMPGHVVLAQVPLSRFVSVPTRYPYAQWLQRAGRLSVDLLVCDLSSRALAAVEVRSADESARSAKRHQRLAEVLRAAGVTVHEWDEDNLPSVAQARGLLATKSAAVAPAEAETEPVSTWGRAAIPVADIQEILEVGDVTDYGQLEPVPSGFFEDEDPRMARQAA